MPTDPSSESVSSLRVWHCGYDSLAPLVQYPNLTTLVVATFPDRDLTCISRLEKLEYLSIVHLPHVTDLGPLARLTGLRTLRLASLPSWDASGRTVEIDSLAPLASLPALTHLELLGVRTPSGSLAELEGARDLSTLRVSGYADAEVARYRDLTSVEDGFAPPPGVGSWQ